MRRGEAHLRGEAVRDKQDRKVELPGDLRTEAPMGVKAARDEPATVEPDDERTGVAINPRVEQERREFTRGTGHRDRPADSEGWGGYIRELHGFHHRDAGGRGIGLLDRRCAAGLQVVQQRLHVGSYAHSAPPADVAT